LNGLVKHEYDNSPQQDAVQEGRQNLNAIVSVGSSQTDWSLGKPSSSQGIGKGDNVGQHMDCVSLESQAIC